MKELNWEFDTVYSMDPAEYLRMFFIFDTVLENSVMNANDAVELFEIIQRESLQ